MRYLNSVVFAVVLSGAAVAEDRAHMPEKYAAFFERYCVSCHGPDKEKGKVRLDTLSFDVGHDIQTADAWKKILGAMNAGEMPPLEEEQPPEDEKAAFLGDLSTTLVAARKKLSDQGNAIVLRRLNAREYENTIRDLLDVTINVSDLPDDGGAGTLDTVGSALFFSPDQFELYLKLGRRALENAIVDPSAPAPAPETVRTEVERKVNRSAAKFQEKIEDKIERNAAWQAAGGIKPATAFGFENEHRARIEGNKSRRYAKYLAEYNTWPHQETGAYLSELHQEQPVDFSSDAPAGDYIVRLRIGAPEESTESRRFIRFDSGVEFNGKVKPASLLDTFQITGTISEPQVLEIPITLTESGPRHFMIREIRPDYYLKRSRSKSIAGPAIWIDWMEIEGPIVQEWPPESHRRIFFRDAEESAHATGYAREIIARFAKRAFREKVVDPAFLDRLVGVYEDYRQAGQSFEKAVRESLAIVLASPSFLYLSEPNDGQKRDLTGRELAVRLSYFLWSSPPDQELLAAARDESLLQPDVLRTQVNRMIDNPKSWEFVTGFNHQWLEMERLELFQFDPKEFYEFDQTTKVAAAEEIYRLFDTILRENLSLQHFLNSDFVVVNGQLANYYGLETVPGPEWQKISLPPNSRRGGLIGTAAVLAMGSDGQNTNPVERGAFVLRKLLNDPPPPAPANVPQLSRVEKELPIRERLSLHREDAQCAHCHRKIDPIGYGLENFDAAGQWRETTKVAVDVNGKRKKREVEIDVAGTLPSGAAFDDYYEFRDLLAEKTGTFSRGLTEKLLEYALGRPVSFSDEELIDQIHAELEQDDYRLRTLIHAITQSNAFQTKN